MVGVSVGLLEAGAARIGVVLGPYLGLEFDGGPGWPVSGDILAGAPGVQERLLELARSA